MIGARIFPQDGSLLFYSIDEKKGNILYFDMMSSLYGLCIYFSMLCYWHIACYKLAILKENEMDTSRRLAMKSVAAALLTLVAAPAFAMAGPPPPPPPRHHPPKDRHDHRHDHRPPPRHKYEPHHPKPHRPRPRYDRPGYDDPHIPGPR